LLPQAEATYDYQAELERLYRTQMITLPFNSIDMLLLSSDMELCLPNKKIFSQAVLLNNLLAAFGGRDGSGSSLSLVGNAPSCLPSAKDSNYESGFVIHNTCTGKSTCSPKSSVSFTVNDRRKHL
jgi:hypothetical protein